MAAHVGLASSCQLVDTAWSPSLPQTCLPVDKEWKEKVFPVDLLEWTIWVMCHTHFIRQDASVRVVLCVHSVYVVCVCVHVCVVCAQCVFSVCLVCVSVHA